MTLIDKKLIQTRFSRHLETYNQHASIQNEVCSIMSRQISYCIGNKPIQRALEVGVGTGFLTAGLFEKFPKAHWFLNDIVPQTQRYIDLLAQKHAIRQLEYLFGDAETIDLPSNLNLVATASTIQWFDDISSFIERLEMAPDGIVALSTFAQDNFKEITASLQGVGLRYRNADWLCKQLNNNGYRILYKEEFIRKLWFETPRDILRHMKLTGVNGIQQLPWSRKKLEQFCFDYNQLFYTKSKGVPLTYHPCIVIAQRNP